MTVAMADASAGNGSVHIRVSGEINRTNVSARRVDPHGDFWSAHSGVGGPNQCQLYR
jgi:hypothetical protein